MRGIKKKQVGSAKKSGKKKKKKHCTNPAPPPAERDQHTQRATHKRTLTQRWGKKRKKGYMDAFVGGGECEYFFVSRGLCCVPTPAHALPLSLSLSVNRGGGE